MHWHSLPTWKEAIPWGLCITGELYSKADIRYLFPSLSRFGTQNPLWCPVVITHFRSNPSPTGCLGKTSNGSRELCLGFFVLPKVGFRGREKSHTDYISWNTLRGTSTEATRVLMVTCLVLSPGIKVGQMAALPSRVVSPPPYFFQVILLICDMTGNDSLHLKNSSWFKEQEGFKQWTAWKIPWKRQGECTTKALYGRALKVWSVKTWGWIYFWSLFLHKMTLDKGGCITAWSLKT